MAVKKIPASYICECDGCKASMPWPVQPSPPGWAFLSFARGGEGHPFNEKEEFLLCPPCGEVIKGAIAALVGEGD